MSFTFQRQRVICLAFNDPGGYSSRNLLTRLLLKFMHPSLRTHLQSTVMERIRSSRSLFRAFSTNWVRIHLRHYENWPKVIRACRKKRAMRRRRTMMTTTFLIWSPGRILRAKERWSKLGRVTQNVQQVQHAQKARLDSSSMERRLRWSFGSFYHFVSLSHGLTASSREHIRQNG